ncbi:MAG: hypothetical protein [Olavius algarvensis Delta 4 endosymbiont]|nr:MAG: hypothetical protein [Olavius algarvensis Delta 4 endosymbiont]
MKFETKLALAINIAALAWAFIFFKFAYLGIALAICAGVWFFVYLKRRQDLLEANFQERFSGKNIRYLDKHAVLKAQKSRGYSQVQGMGYLVLTDSELVFAMQLLDNSISISTDSIQGVGKTKRLLGVGHVLGMLLIEYADHSGNQDALALRVKKLEAWQDQIRAVMRARAAERQGGGESTAAG